MNLHLHPLEKSLLRAHHEAEHMLYLEQWPREGTIKRAG